MSTIDENVPAVEQKSRFEDIIDVFFAPTELFRRRAADRFGPPLIALLVLATAFYFILLPAQTMRLRATVAASMPADPAAQQGVETMMGVMKYAGGIMQPVMYLLMIAIAAALLWIFGRVFDAKGSFREMMLIATYGGFIFLLNDIASLVSIMLHGEDGLNIIRHSSFGLMRFMDPASMSAPMIALASRIDIFAIWQAVIYAIGIHVITGATKQRSAMVAGATWLVAALPAMLGGGATPEPPVPPQAN